MTLAYQLSRRVTLQAPLAGQDEYGEALAGWADVATVWADVQDISGREFVAAGGTQNAVQTKITIRHRAGVASSMRVLDGPDIYNVEAVLGQDRRSLTLMCSRGVSNG